MGNKRMTMPATFRGTTNRRAWAIDLAAIRKRRNVPPEHDASVSAWIIEAPGMNVLYNSYLTMLIHLRATPRGDAMKVNPRMTHELALFGLHIDGDLDLFSKTFGQQMLGNTIASPLITPPLYAGQGVFDTDEAAQAAVKVCVKLLVADAHDPTPLSLAAYWSELEGWMSYMGIKQASEAVH